MRVVHVRAGSAGDSGPAAPRGNRTIAALATQPTVDQHVLTVGRERSTTEDAGGAHARGSLEDRVAPAGAASALAVLAKSGAADLVHIHSARGFGSEVVEAARAGGAAVVVSMSDLGWICERGSCIDAAGVACIPAVTPGSCACRRGTHELAARNATLRRILRPWDIVLTPTLEVAGRLRAAGLEARFEPDPVARTRDANKAGADLVRLYRAALEGRARPQISAPGPHDTPRRVLFVVGAGGAPLHYRVHQKVEQLALRGVDSRIRWYSDPRLSADFARCDAVIVYRAPATRELVDQLREARRRGIASFFDVDDLVFDADLIDTLPIHQHRTRKERDEWIDAAHRYAAMMVECGAGIASTPELARHMHRFGIPAEIHRNGVDTTLAVLSERARRARAPLRNVGATFTVGYLSGTDTHDPDLALIGHVLAQFLGAHPEARLLLMGPLAVPPVLEPYRSRIMHRRVVPAAEFPDHLAALDLNLAPLLANTFTNCKSAIKWSEAALVGVATLASATEPFRDAIRPRMTGLLAGDVETFREELEFAACHPAALAAIADAARVAAFEQGSAWVLGENLLRILATSNRAPALSDTNRWGPESWVTDVEPPRLVAGLLPKEEKVAPGERLGEARVGFVLPSDRGALWRVDVQVATWLELARRSVVMTIRTGRRTLARCVVEPADIGDNGWVAFDLERAVEVPQGAIAEFSSESGQNVGLYSVGGGSRLVNGVEVAGGLRVRTFHEPPIPPRFVQRAAPAPVSVRAEQWFSSHLRATVGRVPRRVRRLVPRPIRDLLRRV